MMRTKLLILAVSIIFSATLLAQNCGTDIFVDEFSTDGSIPAEWTEFNTSGQVTVEGGLLKFDLTADQPSAYRTFTPVSENVTISFNEKSSRNYVKCRFDVLSSNGKYLTSIMIGNDGVGNLQYATVIDATSGLPTTFTGALIDHTYLKNYEYTFAIALDFETNTFNFYFDGKLGGQDIPFTEADTAVAKVSITQISMYAGNGQFYFDNIALSYPGLDKSDLAVAVSSAFESTTTAIISEKYGYSPTAYQALKNAVEEAEVYLTDCDATEAQVNQALQDLEFAKTAFDDSFVDEPVLQFYSAYGFTGEEKEFKCGYYNGNLGDFDDKAISFKLEQGYMATFAQDVDGQGFSKVYIAQDSAVEINLPEELQGSISFLRVSPWYEKQKKGTCGKGVDVHDALESDWYYSWGVNGVSTPKREFIPMSWSGGDGFSGLATCRSLGANMGYNHHLAFNEPDLEDQSNMTVAKALEIYPQLLASGLRIGSPAVANFSYNPSTGEFNDGAWIEEFLDSCMTRGYRVDFIAVHDYVRRSPSTYVARFKGGYDKYNLPVWVTEYNYGNPGVGSVVLEDDVELTKITAINKAFDEADFIERYSIFYFQPSQGQLTIFETRSPIVFNDLGEYYRDHESPYPSYLQDVYEDGPNIPAGIKTQLAVDAGIDVSPNPVTGGVLKLVYSTAEKPKDVTLHLYDISGKELLVKHNTTELDVSELKNGFYMLRIENSQIDAVQKVLIKNN